jgi:hypothetical protein
MTNPSIVNDEDEVLNYTQGLRRQFVDKVTGKGANIPTDVDGANLMLNALNDMDRQALGRKRLKVDQNLGDAMKQGAAIIAGVFDRMAGKGNPFEGTGRPVGTLPDHPSELATIVLVPGELDVVAHELTYNEMVDNKD